MSKYAEDGYITKIRVLDDDEVIESREVYERLESGIGRKAAQIGLAGTHMEDPGVWALVTHPKVLDAVSSVAGPDVVLLSSHFFSKQPAPEGERGKHFVAWHQDVTYWGLRPRKATTAWLAIDDADIENGCMRVIPGTHRDGQREHGRDEREGNLLSVNQSLEVSAEDEARAVDLDLKAGCISVHDGLLIHGSNPNHSNRRRCGLTVRYTTPEVQLVEDESKRSNWLPILLRGEDRYGQMKYVDRPSFA